jgi:predicted DNA-binding transcriptional regulator YafY
MLLQSHGKLSAPRLAEELEVSVRTIYRDIDALGAAGIPVYLERGKNGGCVLLEGYRTSLTGLTPDEVKALFILGVPAPLDQLGITQDIRAALRKLSASLPAHRREEEKDVRSRIHINWKNWRRGAEPQPHFSLIYRSLWGNRKIHIIYSVKIGLRAEKQFERIVAPYGLAAKSGEWYLICADDNRIRVYAFSSILKVDPVEDEFIVPPDFNLISYWEEWCDRQDKYRPSLRVRARLSPLLVGYLSYDRNLRDRIISSEPPDTDGCVNVEMLFESFEEARNHILSMGNGIEVLDPEPLRLSIFDHACRIKEMYETSGN